jgi:hypothetical protein
VERKNIEMTQQLFKEVQYHGADLHLFAPSVLIRPPNAERRMLEMDERERMSPGTLKFGHPGNALAYNETERLRSP